MLPTPEGTVASGIPPSPGNADPAASSPGRFSRWLKKRLVLMLLNRFKVPRDLMRFAFRRHARRMALISPLGSQTYAELGDQTLRLAQVFTHLGVRAQESLFCWLANDDQALRVRLAAMEHGAMLTTFYPASPETLVAEAMEAMGPKLLLYDPSLAGQAARLAAARPDLRTLSMGEPLESLMRSMVPRHSEGRLRPEDIAGYGFTSGTTGKPKAMTVNQGIFLTGMRMVVRNVGVSMDETPDRTLICIPLMGAGSGLVLPTIAGGGVQILPEARDAATLSRLIEQHRATRLFLTPSQLIDLLDLPVEAQRDWSSVRNIVYGTEWLPAAKLEEALRRFGPILQQGYGCAEVLPPVSLLQPQDHWRGDQPAPRHVLSSVGKVVKEVQVRIADDEDNALPTGDIGQVLIKSPTVFSGYWQRPDLNAAVLRGGWLHTGDLGYFDTEGWLNILGREADLLHRAGKTIYPRPVEEILHDHPAVKETTYVQVGDRAVMAVSLRQSWRGQQDEAHWVDEFTRFMGPRVNAALAPDDYRVFEDLPRSLLGKVLRREVRATLIAGMG